MAYRPEHPNGGERELTVRALFFGVILAIILGAANAYVGMKAGLTVAATFPATVMALALLRPLGGGVLEQNITRTTASVGEALVAGAIFTIPAFVITGVWTEFNYWESTLIMLAGGTLGVLFVTFLRRVLVNDPELPFPESVACAELTKAGQAGQTGAGYVFGAMGLSAIIELFKNDIGIKIVKEHLTGFIPFGQRYPSPINPEIQHGGGIPWMTPSASPMLLGVGYIIGWRLAALVFTGGLLAWGLLVPVLLFAGPHLGAAAMHRSWSELATVVWLRQVRPLAVGAMIVAALYTLSRMAGPLKSAFVHAVEDLVRIVTGRARVEDETVPRTERDLPMGAVLLGILGLAIPVGALYWYFTRSVSGTLVTTGLLLVAGFLFAAVVLRMITTSLSIGSGGSGGVFGPSVVIGASLGGGVGFALHSVVPWLAPHPEAYVMVGMAAFFAAAANTPLSSVIIVSEMTGNYNLLVPTMWTAALSFALASRTSLYEKQVQSRSDAPLHSGTMALEVLRRLRARDAMLPLEKARERVIEPSTPFEQLVRLFAETGGASFPVLRDGRLVGVVTDAQIRAALADRERIGSLLVAQDMMTAAITIGESETLDAAVRRMIRHQLGELVVVADTDPERVTGLLSRAQIVAAYDREILKAEDLL